MIYLDNSATTRLYPEVLDAMLPYLQEEYGNPSSKYYTLAKNAQRAVEESREAVAKLIHATPEEIIFTCGSTESTNMILKGVADYRKLYEKKGNHIITSKAEHHATLNTCKYLNGELYSNHDASFSLLGSVPKVDRGFRVSFLDVNQYAQVDPSVFEKEICSDSILASFIWGNNEVGSLNNISLLGTIAKQHDVRLHIDGTQVVGKMDIDVNQLPVDFMSISAHKLHGPKGIGAAYIHGDMYGLPPITSFMHGGEQENGMRAGTLAVHNIVGFGKAAQIALQHQEERIRALKKLDTSVRALLEAHCNVEVLGDPFNHIPGLFSIVVKTKSFDNERFIRRVSEKIAVSTGSACTAGMPSHVLQAMGREDDVSRVIRISLSERNTIDDVRQLLELL